MKKSALLLIAFIGLGLLSACASAPEAETSKSAEELYNTGYKQMGKTQFARAKKPIETVELEHPYSKWATKGKLMGAYAYYRDQKFDDAILALDRFIKFHPGNKDIAYAYYMKGLCYYDQIVGVEKDQQNTARALAAFQQVIARFPDSDYAQDAKLKLDLIYDHLAGQEMEVGRYYLRQKNYLSALTRFSEVVNHYQTTSQIEEALYRQVEIYKILGLDKESRDALKVLRHNYPDSRWTKQAKQLWKK